MTPAGEERALHWLRLKARIEGELESLTALVGIFAAIAQSMEGGAPVGLRWHRELLEDMAMDQPTIRPSVLRPSTARTLDEYLRFRHLFRHIYGSELSWGRLRPLLQSLPAVADAALEDLRRFCGFLADMAARLRRDP